MLSCTLQVEIKRAAQVSKDGVFALVKILATLPERQQRQAMHAGERD